MAASSTSSPPANFPAAWTASTVSSGFRGRDSLTISVPELMGQLLIGLMNGSFYAVLSLGLAVIFGMLHVINFVHGAQYMLGAFIAWLALTALGIGYWPALILVPVVVGLFGIVIE